MEPEDLNDDATAADNEAADLWAEFEQDDADAAAGKGPAPVADEGAADDHQEGDGPIVDLEVNDGADAGADVTTDSAASTVWDNAPAELRTEFERLAAENAKLLQKERSASGRATGFQRRYEDLLKAAQPREAPGDRQSPTAALAALKEDYPEIAAPLEQALGALQGDVQHLHAAEDSRRTAAQTELTEFLDAETAAVEAQHPGFVSILESNSARFVAWIDDQPRAIRDAFQRNAANIVDAAEASTVIGMFKAHIGMPASAPAAADLPATTTRDTLANRRARQLGATANLTRSNRRPTVSGIPENGDPQAIWDAFDEAERR